MKLKGKSILLIFIILSSCSYLGLAQQVEVQGELKVTEMPTNNNEDILVTRKSDGTLGTRSVSSLPPTSPIDSTRNLASDMELAKMLCDCPNLPPFMVQKLLESGYTSEQLVDSGVPVDNVVQGMRGGSLLDIRDRQVYKTVKIGNQTWMAENLNYGVQINNSDLPTNNYSVEKYCYANDPMNCEKYGGLYKWREIMDYDTLTPGTQGICPDGWHIPTDDEWKTLEIELGLTPAQTNGLFYRGTNQGSQLADSVSLWNNNVLVQNSAFGSIGFGALPTGYLAIGSQTFYGKSYFTYFWTSSVSDATNVKGRYLSNADIRFGRGDLDKDFGFPVRCIKD